MAFNISSCWSMRIASFWLENLFFHTLLNKLECRNNGRRPPPAVNKMNQMIFTEKTNKMLKRWVLVWNFKLSRQIWIGIGFQLIQLCYVAIVMMWLSQDALGFTAHKNGWQTTCSMTNGMLYPDDKGKYIIKYLTENDPTQLFVISHFISYSRLRLP